MAIAPEKGCLPANGVAVFAVIAHIEQFHDAQVFTFPVRHACQRPADPEEEVAGFGGRVPFLAGATSVLNQAPVIVADLASKMVLMAWTRRCSSGPRAASRAVFSDRNACSSCRSDRNRNFATAAPRVDVRAASAVQPKVICTVNHVNVRIGTCERPRRAGAL